MSRNVNHFVLPLVVNALHDMNSFISNNYLPDVAVACSNRYPQLLGNEKLYLETGGADLQCILSLFCSAKTDRARVRRNRSNCFVPTN